MCKTHFLIIFCKDGLKAGKLFLVRNENELVTDFALQRPDADGMGEKTGTMHASSLVPCCTTILLLQAEVLIINLHHSASSHIFLQLLLARSLQRHLINRFPIFSIEFRMQEMWRASSVATGKDVLINWLPSCGLVTTLSSKCNLLSVVTYSVACYTLSQMDIMESENKLFVTHVSGPQDFILRQKKWKCNMTKQTFVPRKSPKVWSFETEAPINYPIRLYNSNCLPI